MDKAQIKTGLEIITERQAYIEKSLSHLAIMRSTQTRWISFARDAGATWEQLAHAVNASPQAVAQRLTKWRAEQEAAGAPTPRE